MKTDEEIIDELRLHVFNQPDDWQMSDEEIRRSGLFHRARLADACGDLYEKLVVEAQRLLMRLMRLLGCEDQ